MCRSGSAVAPPVPFLAFSPLRGPGSLEATPRAARCLYTPQTSSPARPPLITSSTSQVSLAMFRRFVPALLLARVWLSLRGSLRAGAIANVTFGLCGCAAGRRLLARGASCLGCCAHCFRAVAAGPAWPRPAQRRCAAQSGCRQRGPLHGGAWGRRDAKPGRQRRGGTAQAPWPRLCCARTLARPARNPACLQCWWQ